MKIDRDFGTLITLSRTEVHDAISLWLRARGLDISGPWGLKVNDDFPTEASVYVDASGSVEVEHIWNCIDPGMYDDLYQCSRCGIQHMVSADNPASDKPKTGCIDPN